MQLLIKVKDRRMTVFKGETRGICLQSALMKWYMGTLLVMAKKRGRADDPEVAGGVCAFGFEEGHKTDEVTETLRAVGAAAEEWGGDFIGAHHISGCQGGIR